MRCLVLIAVVITGILARPETYREKEDFQYSRSSSDEGSKSGYYGAQRGNMGGNYERAHNMDSLAQHQMSGLIHQVDGEVGDTSNANTGSVFTASNSRGMYGSGHYDLSNLEGRNFHEGSSNGQGGASYGQGGASYGQGGASYSQGDTSYGNSHSQSALTNSAYRNHASGSNSYSNSNSYSHSSRHSSSDQSEHERREEIQNSNLRSGESVYQQEHGAHGASSSQDYSWSPYQNRLVSTRPMRILIRPGTRVTVPVATQTQDVDHSASSYDASAYNHNAAKSDAEVIINNDHETSNRQVPSSKHYESSYSYRKEWEKHHSSPGAVPLGVDIDSSIPKTSELYDDTQHTQTYNNQHKYASNIADSHTHQSSNLYGYNSRTNSDLSSQSRHQSDLDVQREKISSDLNDLSQNIQQSNLNQDYTNQQELVNSKPKSYQSSYSYHKSWERQGDPYVIVPVPDVQSGQASQRLSTSSNSHSGYSTHQYGSNRKQSYTSSNGLMDCDCDEEGHIRVARSYNTDQEVQQQSGWEDNDQQSEKLWDGQETQSKWDKIEDLGQQTETKFDKIEDLGQQTENQWVQSQNLEQQSQNQWDKTEDLGQHAQNTWDQSKQLEHQSQNPWDKIEDLGQHAQNSWDQSQNLEQPSHHLDGFQNLGQQSQNPWDKIDLGQHTTNEWDQNQNLEQQSQNSWDKLDLGQQAQNSWDKIDSGQQSEHQWNEDLGQHSQNQNKYSQFDQQTQSDIGQEQATWNKLEKLNEDKHSPHIYNDQSFSNIFTDDVTHYNDKQPERAHMEQKVEQQNYFFTHPTNDLYTHHTDESPSGSRTQYTSSINSLWDKLDHLSGESTFNSNHTTNHSSKESTMTENVGGTDRTVENPTDLGRGDIPDSTIVHAKNKGRGDVPDMPEGLENFKHSSIEKTNMLSTTARIFNKQNKTLQEIEALSLSTKDQEVTEKPRRQISETIMDNENQVINQHIEHSSNSHKVNHHFEGEQNLVGKEKHQQIPNHLHESFNIEHQGKPVYEQKMKQDHTSKVFENNNKQHLDKGLVDFGKLDKNYDQQNLYQHYGDFNQQSQNFEQQDHNLDQQNMEQDTQNLEKPVEIVDLHKPEQNLVDFTKWNENLDKQSINHNNYGFDQQNVNQENQQFEKPMEVIDQQNVDHTLVAFNKWNENLDQASMIHHQEGFDQQDLQNMEQELQNFDKPGESFDEQNLNQNLVDFSQFSENAHQNTHHALEGIQQHSENQNKMQVESQGFDKVTDSFDQQNPNDNFNDRNMNHNYGFSHQSDNLYHPKIEQQLQTFDKLNDNFDQQNIHQNLEDSSKLIGNFDHQSMSKHFERFDQRDENLEQQNMGQEWQNFDKHSEIFNQQYFKENLDNFGQFNENANEPAEIFDQQQNQNFINIEKFNQNLNEHNLQHQSDSPQFDFETGRDKSIQPIVDQSFRYPVQVNEIVQNHEADSNSQHLILSTKKDTEQDKLSQTTLPPEPEQPSFWASVGKKFTSAKDKVSSWFRKKSD